MGNVFAVGLGLLAGIFLGLLLLVAVSLLFTIPAWLLWNYVHPSFLPHIGFLRAWAVVSLLTWVAGLLRGNRKTD